MQHKPEEHKEAKVAGPPPADCDKPVRDDRVDRDGGADPRTKDSADSSPAPSAGTRTRADQINRKKPVSSVPPAKSPSRIGTFTESGTWGDDDDQAASLSELVKPEKMTKLQMAVELICELFTTIHDKTGRIWAVYNDGPRIARPMSVFMRKVRRAWYEEHGDALGKDMVAAAWDVVADDAEDQPQVELPIRVGTGPDGATILDLGGRSGEVVELRPGIWEILAQSPIVFLRSQLTNALPVPVRGSSLEPFRRLFNVSDADWPMLLAWMVAVLIPDIAHPVLALIGEHGSAKTTAGKLVTGVIDPSSAPSRSAPHDERNWSITAAQSYALVLDNISQIREWFSDALCRAVTGDSYVCRKLYTDDELAILTFRRAICFTAIHPGEIRDDLADRLLVVHLTRIDDVDRREDDAVPAVFAADHAEILGAVLDLAVQVFAVLPTIHLTRMPRMASFAKVCAAIDQILGTTSLDTYRAQELELAADVVEANTFATALVEYLALQALGAPFIWRGTAGELLHILDAIRKANKDPRPPGWPTHSVGVAAQLRRTAPALGRRGVLVSEPVRTGHDRKRVWTITYTPPASLPDDGADELVESPASAAVAIGVSPDSPSGYDLAAELGIGASGPPPGWYPPGMDPDEYADLRPADLRRLWDQQQRVKQRTTDSADGPTALSASNEATDDEDPAF